ncbi:hybrid sensor histidine kinase/response regulator transcription factor [Reichenbachiella versicolor]|uniref:hybrid sensor histidine kinase/response regulator transcription factor n=1 Tax=Reichenbachiella versicolor TaxID=1821036 RepID=UPI000D6E6788|nr:hybrid sensor histidine kinase/response regulator transcription factor [Reichenbachiella versicolor]
MLRSLIVVLGGIVSILPAMSQTPSIQKIDTRNGLSQNNVACILHDQYGYSWFGTDDGLNKYDGYDFVTFRINLNSDTGLSSNLILTLEEAPDQKIWIGTADQGICVYDPKTEVIRPFKPDFLPNHILNHRVIDFKFINENVTLILTPTRLFVYDKKDGEYQIRKFGNKNHLEIDDGVFKFIHPVSESKVLLGSIKGLYYYEWKEEEFEFEKVHLLNQKHIRSIIDTPNHGQIYSIDNSIIYRDSNGKLTNLIDGQFKSMVLDHEGDLWAASKHGIHVFKVDLINQSLLQTALYTEYEDGEPINGREALDMSVDHSGIIWVGLRDDGLIRIDKRGKNIALYNDFNNRRVNCIYEDSKKNIWVGTTAGGVFKGTVKEYNHIAFTPVDFEFEGITKVLAMTELNIDNQNYLVTGTHFKVNHKKHIIHENGTLTNSDMSAVLDSVVYATYAMISDEDYLWIGTYGQGLARYNYKIDVLDCFLPSNTNIPSKIVRSLMKDSKGRIWVGTDKGLCVISKGQRDSDLPSFKVYTPDIQNPHSISHNYILPITESSTGKIWIGTLGGGVNILNENTDTFQKITTDDGLSNNSIKALLEDDNGNMWLSSNKGISKIDLPSMSISNFDLNDGLQDHEFTDLSMCKLSNGHLAFGGVNGINVVDPNLIHNDIANPKLFFTDLQVLNQQIRPSQKINGRVIIKANLNEIPNLELQYQENSFVVGFTALQYSSPQKVQYEYILDGFDDNWIKTDWRSRFAKYTSLLPGDYTLRIRAINGNGQRTTQELTLPIKIIRPLWLSNGALILYTILIIGAVAMRKRYSIIKTNTKNTLLADSIEREKTKELTQLKLRFFTNISHEFRTPLSIILGYLDQLSDHWNKNDKESAKQDFSIIKRNANVMLRLINQLIDFRKFEQGKMSLNAAKGDIVSFVKDVYRSFQVLADQKDITLSIESSTDKISLVFDHDMMEKILNNLLSNALKYTQNCGHVEISVSEDSEFVQIEVRDSGVGIPEEMQKRIFERFYVANSLKDSNINSSGIGLSFTKSLVDMHGGEISLISKTNEGTTFLLKFSKKLEATLETELITRPEIDVEELAVQDIETPSKPTSSESFIYTVMIVEDNPELLQYLTSSLNSDYQTVTAKNGKEALDFCAEQIPDLIISDVMMPVMDGIELCSKIKNNERLSHIPVVLLTAKTSIESELQGFQHGADAYVSKPFNMTVLKARIKAIGKSRQNIWTRFKENPLFIPSKSQVTSADQSFLKKVSDLIDENLSKSSFSVEQLASNFNMSHTTFFKKLKSIVGVTPNQYMRSIRLKKAADMLLEDEYNVTEIIYNVGFSDLRYFREQFKKTYNVTPRDYRKLHNKASMSTL